MLTAFASDVALMLKDFGQSITLNGSTVQAIFDNAYTGMLGMESSGPALTVASSDVAGVEQGHAVVVGSANYTVVTVEPDGTGVTVLRLQEA
jgi:hypothetical protein